MKKLKVYILGIITILMASGCEDFLDKSPDMGLSEKDVYADYSSLRGFLDQSYKYLENIHGFNVHENYRSSAGSISDEFASVFNLVDEAGGRVHSGNWLKKKDLSFEIGVKGNTMISNSYKALRIANRVIANIDKAPGLTSVQHNEILGQAHFMRAWFYFQLIKRYGGMPIMDKVFVGDGDEDIPRLTYHGSNDWMMTDINKAIELLPDMWDESNTGRVNKVAAMAFKSMAQLYDASPLMQNNLQTIEIKQYDTERAKLAAQSASEVLTYISIHPELNNRMVSSNEYHNIFYWPSPPFSHPEYLWYNRIRIAEQQRYIRAFYLPAEYSLATGWDGVVFQAPTQNMVDLFEKKGADGIYYPITNPKSGYNNQQPFTDRDPRLKNNILVPGEKWGVDKSNKQLYITTYVGGQISLTLLSNSATNARMQTGYLCKKFIWEGADNHMQLFTTNRIITAYIRVAQIYLDLAEASFEATGSATAIVEGCTLSAEEALNVVRERVGLTRLPAEIVNDPVQFREAYRRERAVELMFENHRWWDLRRWMIMHEVFQGASPIKGLSAVPVNPNHNQVVDKSTLQFTYETIDLTPEIRAYTMRNYWYPFPLDDVASLKNLVQNPEW